MGCSYEVILPHEPRSGNTHSLSRRLRIGEIVTITRTAYSTPSMFEGLKGILAGLDTHQDIHPEPQTGSSVAVAPSPEAVSSQRKQASFILALPLQDGDFVLVEFLEAGFQNLREHITYQQIVGTPFLL